MSYLQWQKVYEDDVLLLMMMLYVVAQMGRDVTLRNNTTKALKPRVAFLIEQPAISERFPESASLWKLECWHLMKFFYHFKEYTFMQGDFGGIARKPTTLGTNLELTLPDPKVHGGRSREDGPDIDSRELARWAPRMMREIATALTQQVQDKQVMMRKLSWQEHVANVHFPFRRDCVICQRASATRRPHRRQEHPEAHVLALDLCGPLKWGNDIDGDEKRYLLAGSYTWPAEGKEPIDLDDDGAPEDEVEVEGEEPLPQLDDEERSEDRREAVRQAGERREEEDEARRRAERGEVEEVEEEDDDQQKEDEEQQEEGGAPRT